MHWLSVVPLAVLTASIEMLPRLEAEEAFDTVERVAVGTGSYSADTSRQIRAEWQRAINDGKTIRAVKASPRDLRSMGIGHRKVKRQKPAEAPADG